MVSARTSGTAALRRCGGLDTRSGLRFDQVVVSHPLLTELHQLRAENAQLRAENAAFRARLAQQDAQIALLTQQFAHANERIAELTAVVARYQAQKKRSKGGKTPPPPPPPEAPEAKDAYENRPLPPPLPEKPEKVKKPVCPRGRAPLPEHLPVEETTLRPKDCCHCGSCELEMIDEVVEEKLTVVSAHQRRRRVIRKTARCKRCLKRTTARSLPAPFARSKVTCAWLAWFVTQKFFLLLPLDRIQRHLALQRVRLSISFLVSQVERAADLAAVIDGEHWRELLAGSLIQSDGTGWSVRIAGVAGTYRGYLEVYRRDEIVVFQYEARKDAETQKAKLQRFTGTLLVDAEHRYNATFESGRIVEAGCNAHGVRKFEAAEASQPALALEGGQFLSAVYAMEKAGRAQGRTGESLRVWRQEKIGPILAQFRRWLEAVAPVLLPSEPLMAAVRYYLNHWEALTRFVDDPSLPLDNNDSEREFQTIAKARHAFLFAGSVEGAHRLAILMGVCATCRNLGVDPQAYFTWLFERVGTHKDLYGLPAAQLTPRAYKASRDPPHP